MRTTLIVLAAALCIAAVTVQTAGAQPICGTISGLTTANPGPFADNYLAGTRKCALTAGPLPPFPDTQHCSDNLGIEAEFSPTLSVRQASVVGGGWLTWSSPPFAEINRPFVGFTSGAATLNVNLTNGPAQVLGMEAEPNAFGVFLMTAQFFSGPDQTGSVVATITQPVEGNAGARLFAAVCTQPVIQSARIVAPAGAVGFAIAQLRSDAFTGIFGPEPADVGPPITPPDDANMNTTEGITKPVKPIRPR